MMKLGKETRVILTCAVMMSFLWHGHVWAGQGLVRVNGLHIIKGPVAVESQVPAVVESKVLVRDLKIGAPASAITIQSPREEDAAASPDMEERGRVEIDMPERSAARPMPQEIEMEEVVVSSPPVQPEPVPESSKAPETSATQKISRMRLGKLKVLPSAGIEIELDSNIYNANGTSNVATNDEYVADDIITHVKPGLHLVYTMPQRGKIDVGYDGDFVSYNEYSRNDRDTQRLAALMNYKSPKGLLLDFSTVLIDTQDPFTTANEYGITALNTSQKKERAQHTLNMRLGYALGNKFKVFSYANRERLDYDRDDNEDRWQDYLENELGLGVERRIAPKTWGFLRYFIGNREFDGLTAAEKINAADTSYSRITAGLGWDPGGKLSGELNLGQKKVGFENSRDTAGNLFADVDMLHANTSVTYQLNPNTSGTFTLARDIRYTTGISRETNEDTSYGIRVSHKFFTKFIANVGLSMGTNDYNTVNLVSNRIRSDENMTVDAGLSYQIRKWLFANISYRYAEKDSNLDANDYEKSLIIFGLKAIYDKSLR